MFKNKQILHIKLKIINQLFEGGGAQNCVLWPRAQKYVNPALGPNHAVLITTFFCLKFDNPSTWRASLYSSLGPHRKRLFHYCVFSYFRGNNVFTELFPSNDCYTVACLHSCCLGIHVKISSSDPNVMLFSQTSVFF
jgi:hypothetical protein